jgi:hypothetical protein
LRQAPNVSSAVDYVSGDSAWKVLSNGIGEGRNPCATLAEIRRGSPPRTLEVNGPATHLR